MRSRLNPSFCFCIVCACVGLAFTSGCGFGGSRSAYDLPPGPPPTPDVVSLNPQDWYILWSSGVGPHPSADPGQGAWSFPFPHADPSEQGHVNYVQTPFRATKTPQEVVITFNVQSAAPQYEALNDILPATFRLFFEQKHDDGLSNPNGRWWANAAKFALGPEDNQVHVIKVPLKPEQWGNVEGTAGSQDPNAFWSALANVGWFGLTFGGQNCAGHGVALSSGSAKFVLIGYEVLE